MRFIPTTTETADRDPVAVADLEGIGRLPKMRRDYPATRAQIIEASFDPGECCELERRRLFNALPDVVFESAEELLTALLG